MKPVAVLGTGPAGLMAAHAVAIRGLPVALFGRAGADGMPLRSTLGGAQFLHSPLPRVNSEKPDAMLVYRVSGDPAVYRQKVYGDDPNVPFVSMEGLRDGQEQPAWSLEGTYDALWSLLSVDNATIAEITPAWIIEALEKEWFSRIISSIPGPSICMAHAGMINELHHFISQRVLIMQECILDSLPNNEIVYDGTTDRSWYRCSRIFGIGGTEWSSLAPNPRKMTEGKIVEVRKPLRTNCSCFPEVLRVGRYGRWKKGVLTHHAFETAFETAFPVVN